MRWAKKAHYKDMAAAFAANMTNDGF